MNDSSRPGRPGSSTSAPGKAGGRGVPKVAANVALVVTDLVGQGREAIERGDIDAARRALNGASSRAPKHRDVMVLKALVLSAEGDPEAALDVLDDAMDMFPDDVAVAAHKAFILLDEIGDPEEALPLLQGCLDTLKEGGHDEDAGLDVELGLRLVDAQLALGDVDGAVAAGRDVVVAAGSGDAAPLAHASLARSLMAAGKLDAARAEADLAVTSGPDNFETWTVLGRVAITMGDDATADKAFGRAFTLEPELGQPPRLSPAAFKAAFDSAVMVLPQPLRGYVQKLPLSFVLHADAARLDALERSPETPFLVDGPLREPGSGDPYAHQPTAAVIYQRSLESLCGDVEELEGMIIAVVVEGVGMFLGLDFGEDLTSYTEVMDDDG